MPSQSSDVVIIGAGIAGLVAAHECLDNGRSVTLIDRHGKDRIGGLARTAFGGMALVGTPLQRRLGIRDTPALALSDWLSFAEFADEDVWPRHWAESYVEQSADRVFHWLRGKGLPAGEPDSKTRLVILQCNDPYIGMLGILQYLDPPLPEPEPRPVPNRVKAGEIVFVMHNDDVEGAYRKLLGIEGIEIVAEPHVSEYPKDDGGVFRVLGISFFDPNGYFIELNQFNE